MTDNSTPLCCPLCGHDEYLLSEKNQFLCAKCGTFLDDVSKVVPSITIGTKLAFSIPSPNANLCH